MKTFSELVEGLISTNLDMWNAQEELYKIRKMAYEDFKAQYDNDNYKLYDVFKRACDLNMQRNVFIDAVDETLYRIAVGRKNK